MRSALRCRASTFISSGGFVESAGMPGKTLSGSFPVKDQRRMTTIKTLIRRNR
jgi:hypothetical protein